MTKVIDRDADGRPIRARDRVVILESCRSHKHLEGRTADVLGDASPYFPGKGATVGLDLPYGDGRRVAMAGKHLRKVADRDLGDWDSLRETLGSRVGETA